MGKEREQMISLTEDSAVSVRKSVIQNTKAQHLEQLRQQVQQSQQQNSPNQQQK